MPLPAARRVAIRSFLLATLGVAAVTVQAFGATAAPGAVEGMSTHVLAAPSPVLGTDNRRHLVYELQFENSSDVAVTVERLAASDGRRGTPLLTLAGDLLPEQLLVLGAPGPTTTLAPGDTGFAFLDVPLAAHALTPHVLAHRLTLSWQRAGGPPVRQIVEAAPTRVDRHRAAVLSSPLRGLHFLAVDACCARGVHAHSLAPFDGRWLGAQRYAIDWLQLNDALDSSSAGDPTHNDSYLIWGEDVHAVASGRIVATRDDLLDNTPPLDPPDQPALEELAGNRVVEDIGAGRFAVYAHLQHHGVEVRVGDRVRRGDVLGRVGNSGGSSEPHLHFQIADAAGGASALAANALPFVVRSFRLEGSIPDFETGEIIPPPPPAVRTGQLPLTGDITGFAAERPEQP